jgi:uncharacterized protein
MTNYYIIPGLGNSDETHWQTYFESLDSNIKRINQVEWDAPNCADWLETIDLVLAETDLSTVVLIGHSLGCATIAHWVEKYKKTIKGAMLVAPSDLETPQYATFPTTGFTPMSLNKLPFKSIVVASSNDVWVTTERALHFANAWGSEFINIGEAGHINVASGHGEWKEGFELLKKYFG